MINSIQLNNVTIILIVILIRVYFDFLYFFLLLLLQNQLTSIREVYLIEILHKYLKLNHLFLLLLNY
jgi:hypothetical protein